MAAANVLFLLQMAAANGFAADVLFLLQMVAANGFAANDLFWFLQIVLLQMTEI